VLSFLEWLLELDNIRLARDAPLLFRWGTRLQPWMLFGFALFAASWIAVLYRREKTTVPRRIVLGALRGTLVALIVAVMCGPSLVLQRNRVEPSFVALLLDTSMSMAAKDTFRSRDLAEVMKRGAGLPAQTEVSGFSRLDLARMALTRDDAAPIRTLLAHNGIQLFTFSASTEAGGIATSVDAAEAFAASLPPLIADGPSSDIPAAILRVVEQAQGRRLAAIVLVSDGQATQATNLKDALDTAADRQVPVFALRIGSPDPVFDIEVGPLRAQESVFANDILAVEVQVSSRGLSEEMEVQVRLVDERTSGVAVTETVSLGPQSASANVELRTKPTQPGRHTYRVEVVPRPGETTAENNVERIAVLVLENRLRILYVDGYPRFEYRYLKNALIREPTIELSVLLLEADDQFVQEGTDPIRRFPETPEELNRFDVVLFGDVDPRGGWLTSAQMNMLLDYVGNEGGGFGLIAGERAAPHRFADTPLEKLVPVRIDTAFLGRYERPLITGFRVEITPEGRRSRLFRFTADRDSNNRLLGTLPEIFWLARTLGARPGASVLAEHPGIRTDYGLMPVIVTGRYGAGKLFFQATDDTWRWRHHTGELLHDAYWVQVARELMPASKVARDRRYALRTDRRVYEYGATVRASVEVFDAELLAQLREVVEVELAESAAPAGQVSMELERDPAARSRDAAQPGRSTGGRMVSKIELHRTGEESNLFEGAFVPAKPGSYVLDAPDIAQKPGETRPSVAIRVERPDIEFRRPQADHETLERIAVATDGRLVDLDRLNDEFASVQDRSVQIPDDVTEPLWDSKLVLILFVLIISTEWVLRKAFGLL